MIVAIEPIKGLREIADRVDLEVVNYKLCKPVQEIRYCLKSETNDMIEQGNIDIPASINEQWGDDDMFIIDWALKELGVKPKNEESIIDGINLASKK